MIIISVDPKIKILFFFVKEPRADVMIDFSVSFIPVSFSTEIRLNNAGIKKCN